MSEEHEQHVPPAQFSYAVGAGLGLLVGGTVGLFLDHFLIDALFGVAIGLVVAYIVRNIKT
jgi:hypothetical protein